MKNRTMAQPSLRFEPLTFLEGAAAVLGIAAAIKGLLSGNEKDEEVQKRLDEINKNVLIVIQYEQIILAELKAMKLYFREELLQAFITDTSTWTKAYSDDLDRIKKLWRQGLSSSGKKKILAQLEEDRIDNEHLVSRLYVYGPAAYTAEAAAIGILIGVYATAYQLARNSAEKKDVVKFARAMLEQLLKDLPLWLDSSQPVGIPAALSALKALAQQYQSEINAIPRRIFVSERTQSDSEDDGFTYCSWQNVYQTFVNIEGGGNAPFVERFEEIYAGERDRHCHHHHDHPGPTIERKPLSETVEISEQVAALLTSQGITESDRPLIFSPTRPETVRLEQLREAIVDLTAKQVELSKVASNLSDFIDALKNILNMLPKSREGRRAGSREQ